MKSIKVNIDNTEKVWYNISIKVNKDTVGMNNNAVSFLILIIYKKNRGEVGNAYESRT